MSMLSGKTMFAVALIAAALTSTVSASNGPREGVYSVSSYVVSAVATNGGSCGASQGDYLSSYFYYPGPGKYGAVERHSINGPNGSYIQELHFPLTPASGMETWSGRYRSALFPGGTSQFSTFATTFTFVDEDSFLGTTTYTYAVGGDGVCNTVFQNTYIRTGSLSN